MAEMKGKGKADPIDAHVGAQLRAFRQQAGLNQTELAKALGVTFQQVQKYEKGVNRVSASMLARASQALNCGVETFFPSADESTGEQTPQAATGSKGRELLAIMAAMNPKQRDLLLNVARSMAHSE